jgi:hypothetical protein
MAALPDQLIHCRHTNLFLKYIFPVFGKLKSHPVVPGLLPDLAHIPGQPAGLIVIQVTQNPRETNEY